MSGCFGLALVLQKDFFLRDVWAGQCLCAILLVTDTCFFSLSTVTSLGWFKTFFLCFFCGGGWDLLQSLFLLYFVLHTVAFSPTLLFPELTEGGMFRAWLMAGKRGRRGHWHPTPCPSFSSKEKLGEKLSHKPCSCPSAPLSLVSMLSQGRNKFRPDSGIPQLMGC